MSTPSAHPVSIVIAAGGTGGHIFLALAVWEALSESHPEMKLTWIGSSHRMEADLIPAAAALKRDPALDLPFTGLGFASFDGIDVGMPNEYDEVLNAGVDKGDPNLSSAETGQVLADKLVNVIARFVAHFEAKT